MTYSRSMLVSLFVLCSTFAPNISQGSEAEPEITNINEIIIPEFQAAAIAKDGAVIDTLITADTLWILTNKILWKWNYLDRKVQKITLIQKSEAERLVSLGFDGLNLYVSFTSGVYQLAIKQGKVFKYPFPNGKPIKKADFYGEGDSFWLVANGQISKIDRYGKTISPTAKVPETAASSITGFDATNQLFWYANKNVLFKWTVGSNKAEKVLQLKQTIRSVVAKNEGVIVTTSQTVLISDGSGKRIQTIPVEKSRKIVSASNQNELHAYLFNDQILETFDLRTQSVGRYLLPIDSVAKIRGIKVGAGLVYLIADGKVRLFALPAKSNLSK